MTAPRESAYWYAVCGTRVTAGYPSLVDDPVYRAILANASIEVTTTGVNGRMWKFRDGSMLIGTRDAVVVR